MAGDIDELINWLGKEWQRRYSIVVSMSSLLLELFPVLFKILTDSFSNVIQFLEWLTFGLSTVVVIF